MNKYDDIINLPHHQSKTHPKMSVYDRAAQFAPFAALTGYEEVLEETARLTDDEIFLSDDNIEILNQKLAFLKSGDNSKNKVLITHFVKDPKKDGGKFVLVQGKIYKIDDFNKVIILTDKQTIRMQNITKIDILKEEE